MFWRFESLARLTIWQGKTKFKFGAFSYINKYIYHYVIIFSRSNFFELFSFSSLSFDVSLSLSLSLSLILLPPLYHTHTPSLNLSLLLLHSLCQQILSISLSLFDSLTLFISYTLYRTDIQTHRNTDTKTLRHTQTHTDTYRHRQTHTQRNTDRHTHTFF